MSVLIGWAVMAAITVAVLLVCSAFAADPEDPADDLIHELDGIGRPR